MEMMRCQGLLGSGFPCNTIAPWKPHGYPLCKAHWSQGKCYFMELPVEVRLLIYSYIAPDKSVPVVCWNLRKDWSGVSTALFCVNKTIHDEYAGVFYGKTTFEVEITNRAAGVPPSIFMCPSKTGRVSANEIYRRQLFLLEQHNRARGFNQGPGTGRATSSPLRLPEGVALNTINDFAPWKPPLSLRYFQKIRSFHIRIEFYTVKTPRLIRDRPTTDAIPTEVDRNLLSDYSHRFIHCLLANKQSPLPNLDITICIRELVGDEARANYEGIAHCQALINPMRRLRTHTASIISFNRIIGEKEISMLPPSPKGEHLADKFVQDFCAEITKSPIPQRSPILITFAQLAEIVSRMSQHPFWSDHVEEMESILSNGRSARETQDVEAMMSAFREVFEMHKKYNADHREFIKKMNRCFAMMRPNDKYRSG
jgi:hypothetical protein